MDFFDCNSLNTYLVNANSRYHKTRQAMKYRFVTLAALISTIFLACSKEDKSTDLVTFPLRGEVVGIDTAAMRIMVDHEEIPDYMMAMTMPFKIKNKELLNGLQVGDTIQGVLAVSRTESWLETFSVAGKGSAPDPQLVEGALMAKVIKEGDALGGFLLTDQDGKKVRFEDFRGKALAITFIYSRCPLPDFCILMSNNFGKIQKQLSRESALNNKWHLMTISFDPAFDTPSVLKDYGKSYGADFATWTFVTDSMSTIYRLADGFGLTLADDDGLIAHNLRTILVNADGKIETIINGNEWKAEEVAEKMKQLTIDN